MWSLWSESIQSLSPFAPQPRCPQSHVSSPCPFSSPPDTLLSSLRLLPRPPIHPPVVSQEVLHDSYRIISRSRDLKKKCFYVALNSEGDEIERWLMWRENKLICILQRRHSNCHFIIPRCLLLFTFSFTYFSHRASDVCCRAGLCSNLFIQQAHQSSSLSLPSALIAPNSPSYSAAP